MKRIKRDSALSKSKDIIQSNIDDLKSLFPEIVSEDKINFESLKKILGENVNQGEESYKLDWVGKSDAERETSSLTTGTLRPDLNQSLNWNATQNLYIEGDNLEVLKILQKSYTKKIKMIYIDPPYNTGKDFVYRDNYKDNLKNYQKFTNQLDGKGNKITTNIESDGRYHTNWLNMMYPRLQLARNLLKSNGVIFISIDDNEVHNLRKICDMIFGDSNLIANMVWQQGRKSMSSTIAVNHEYCLIYAKNREIVLKENSNNEYWKKKKTGLDKIFNEYKRLSIKNKNNFEKSTFEIRQFYKSLDSNDPSKKHKHYKFVDQKGVYFASDISQGTGKGGKFDIIHPKTKLTCKLPNGGWRFSENSLKDLLNNDMIHFGKDESVVPCLKRYLHNVMHEVPQSVFYKDSRGASKRLDKLFDNVKVFEHPKDEEILKEFISFVTSSDSSDDIILDFFSGSASTAHAVMQLNLENGYNLSHIQVQLPEKIDKKSEAYKAGYKTISDIGKERIRRAANKIKKEYPNQSKDMDLGFKVFRLNSSNLKAWDGNPEKLKESLFDSIETIKSDRSQEDVVYELLLKSGFDLNTPIQVRTIEEKNVFNIGLGSLFICLEDNIPSKIAEGIGEWSKEHKSENIQVIFKDSGFNDVDKVNSSETLKKFGITEINSI